MLEVHHKDGDVTNIAVSNLETVCVNCHQREHNPGFLEGAQRYPGPGFREKHSTTAQARLERGINGEVSGESRNTRLVSRIRLRTTRRQQIARAAQRRKLSIGAFVSRRPKWSQRLLLERAGEAFTPPARMLDRTWLTPLVDSLPERLPCRNA